MGSPMSQVPRAVILGLVTYVLVAEMLFFASFLVLVRTDVTVFNKSQNRKYVEFGTLPLDHLVLGTLYRLSEIQIYNKVSLIILSDGRPWWGPEPPRDSLGRRVRTEAEEDAGRGRLRQERHAPPWPPLPSRAPLGHPPACAGSIAPPAGRRPHAWRAKAEALTGCDRLGLPGLGAAGGE